MEKNRNTNDIHLSEIPDEAPTRSQYFDPELNTPKTEPTLKSEIEEDDTAEESGKFNLNPQDWLPDPDDGIGLTIEQMIELAITSSKKPKK